MARPYWRGYLKLSLVTCPVQLSPATTESEKVRFQTINSATGNRIASRYVDAVTGKPVDEDDEAKGYERAEGDFIVLEEEELDNVALDSAKTIDIDKFVSADSIGWIWLESPYFITPSDPVGVEAYAVIRDAMRASGKVGISRIVIGRRERACILQPKDNGITLWTLKFGEEVRDEDVYFSGIPAETADPELKPLIGKLIKAQTTRWSPAMVADPVQERLLEMIAEKKKALKPKAASRQKSTGGASGGNVINIMDTLRKSLQASKSRKTS
jgi:DNA end-binding protein Ku